METSGAVKRSTALANISAVRCPSIGITCVDDAVDYHLIPNIKDLWPHPLNEEEEDDLVEVLRTNLRMAITQVLSDRSVRVVET